MHGIYRIMRCFWTHYCHQLLYIFEVKLFILLSHQWQKILAILTRRAKSHCAPFHFGVYPLAFVRNIAKSSAAAGRTGRVRRIRMESGARAKLKAVTGRCQTRHGAERIREIGTEGNIKHVLYPVKALAHVPSNLLFRYSLVAVSSTDAAPVFRIILVHI